MQVEKLLNKQQMGDKLGLFAKVTIFPGESLDDHEHHGETETYYVLSGEESYRGNDKVSPAKAGDVFFCEDGGRHGIACTGSEPLVFIALIIKK